MWRWRIRTLLQWFWCWLTRGQKPVVGLLLALTLAAGGCATTSKITTTTTAPDGTVTVVEQEMTDEAAFMQAQKDSVRPIFVMEAHDDERAIELKNVKRLEVYAGDGAQIRQYVHPGWNVLAQYGGVAGAILGAAVAGHYANELAATVGAAAGTRYVSSFNASGDQSTTALGNSGAANYTPATTTTTTTTDSHDVLPAEE